MAQEIIREETRPWERILLGDDNQQLIMECWFWAGLAA